MIESIPWIEIGIGILYAIGVVVLIGLVVGIASFTISFCVFLSTVIGIRKRHDKIRKSMFTRDPW